MTPTTATDTAREIWDALSRSENPMPVYAAIDLLRERLDTDKVSVVKGLLYEAAADALDEVVPHHTWDVFGPQIRERLRDGAPAKCRWMMSRIAAWCRQNDLAFDKDNPCTDWTRFVPIADKIIKFCHLIEAEPG